MAVISKLNSDASFIISVAYRTNRPWPGENCVPEFIFVGNDNLTASCTLFNTGGTGTNVRGS
jgi:hypothetical protein